MGDFTHYGSTPDGGLSRVVVVSDTLIGCSSILGLFVCHFIPHYHAVAWTPGDGYLAPFIVEGSKGVLDVTPASALDEYCNLEVYATKQNWLAVADDSASLLASSPLASEVFPLLLTVSFPPSVILLRKITGMVDRIQGDGNSRSIVSLQSLTCLFHCAKIWCG